MKAAVLHERNRSFFVSLVIFTLVALPSVAFAQSGPWDQTAENTYNLIMSVVRWVAIIGVIGCGLAAMFGKLSWDWAGKIVVGLVLIFGATQIVDYFSAGMGG